MEMKTSVIPNPLPTDQRLRRTQPGSLQRKQVSSPVAPECESVTSQHSPTSLTFPTTKAPCILLCSQSDLGLFHQIDTEKLLFFIPEIRRASSLYEYSSASRHSPNSHPRSLPSPGTSQGRQQKGKGEIF